jgi:hypothetical protein
MKFLLRLRAILAFVLNRPFKVRLHRGDAWLYPAESVVLPVIAGADGDGDEDDDEAAKKKEEEEDEDEDDSGDADDVEAQKKKEDEDEKTTGAGDEEWKGHARRHEREAKKARKRAKELEEELKAAKDKDKSEQEKAIEKAKDEGRSEASTKAEKERRNDRLEVAVTRLANKPIKVGEGDDAKTLKFADSDDALVYIERAISRGDIDGEDIFDSDGKVLPDAVGRELARLLEDKPHLARDGDETDAAKKKTAKGGVDQKKGGADGNKDLDDMSTEEHLKRIQKGKAA